MRIAEFSRFFLSFSFGWFYSRDTHCSYRHVIGIMHSSGLCFSSDNWIYIHPHWERKRTTASFTKWLKKKRKEIKRTSPSCINEEGSYTLRLNTADNKQVKGRALSVALCCVCDERAVSLSDFGRMHHPKEKWQSNAAHSGKSYSTHTCPILPLLLLRAHQQTPPLQK